MLRTGMAGRITVNVAEVPMLAAVDRLPAPPTPTEAEVNHLEL